MKELKYTSLILFVGLLLMSSCNKLDPISTDKFTDPTFWQSETNADLMVNMAYNQMYSADKMWNDEALSDNLFEGRTITEPRAIRNGTADPSLGLFAKEWKEAYGAIKTCHTYMANVGRVPDMTEAKKLQRIAEIRFIRAYTYFRLVNFYGDVPFFTQDITLEESYTVKRTPKAEIIAFIHAELDDIGQYLPNRDALPAADNGRITKGAVAAFQARAYLYESNWAKVVEYCESLINQQNIMGTYSLFPNYAGLFTAANEYNAEVILDYGYVPSLKMWNKLYNAAPLSAGANLNSIAPLQSLVDNYITLNGLSIDKDASYNDNNPYRNRDPRMAATLVFHGGEWQNFDNTVRTVNIQPNVGGDQTDVYSGASANTTSTGYYIKKYYDVTATATFESGLNIMMFRYADILLMYAEAKQALGQFDASVWDLTIKPIRFRAGFRNDAALNFPTTVIGDAMTELIRNERRSELALEGLRYFDIIRWKAGKKYLDGEVRGAKFANNNTSYIRLDTRRFDENRDYLWSVPRSEMDMNKNLLPNNPGFAN